MNKDYVETKLGLWLYQRGVLGLIRLAFELWFGSGVELGKKLYKEIF